MRYLSVCSGIEAATQAWHPFGWEPVAFSEIEPFPCKVLAHHYPQVPNHGDMINFKEWPDANVDLLVGGTPCQSFSIAGLRKGLADPRGNLMLTYLAIAAKYRPTWLVWENVPGVLSSNGGKDFGTFLAGLGECGYGFAYRVLDAQYCRTDGYPYAVPQRRRRVFVVGHLGDWRRAAAVLFDSESLRGNPPPCREARKEVAKRLTRGTGQRYDFETDTFAIAMRAASPTITQNYGKQVDSSDTALGPNIVIGSIDCENNGRGADDATGPLMKGSPTGGGKPLPAVAFKIRGGCEGGCEGYLGSEESAFTLSTTHDQDVFTQQTQVRRLTPTECARLQGFNDDYLPQVPGYSDSAAYKALGNSMAVNCMQLIGQRIQMVNEIAHI